MCPTGTPKLQDSSFLTSFLSFLGEKEINTHLILSTLYKKLNLLENKIANFCHNLIFYVRSSRFKASRFGQPTIIMFLFIFLTNNTKVCPSLWLGGRAFGGRLGGGSGLASQHGKTKWTEQTKISIMISGCNWLPFSPVAKNWLQVSVWD